MLTNQVQARIITLFYCNASFEPQKDNTHATVDHDSIRHTLYGRAIQLQIQLGQIFKPRRLAGPVISAAKQLVMTHFKTNKNKFIEYM